MDLFCEEEAVITSTASPVSGMDENLLDDDRVLEVLLRNEVKYVPSSAPDSYKQLQKEIKPWMRKHLTLWMLDVCEELKCEESTFPLAVNYVDRFVSVKEIRASQFQLLGAVCLSIASKQRQRDSIPLKLLVHYTEDSFTEKDVIYMELLVLTVLEWDVCSVVASDFVDYFLSRLSLGEKGKNRRRKDEVMDTIKRHTATLISLCCTECKFSKVPPSMVAAASLFTAIQNLMGTNKKQLQRHVLDQLNLVTGIEVDCLRECQEQIEEMMASYVPPPSSAISKESSCGTLDKLDKLLDHTSSHESAGIPCTLAISADLKLFDESETRSKLETPTDVQEIDF